MKIITTQVLKDYEGKDITSPRGEKVTLRDVVGISFNLIAQDKPMTAEDKNKAFQIASKLYDSKEVELTIDDMAFIKEWVFKFQSPLIAGRIAEIFEKKKKEEK